MKRRTALAISLMACAVCAAPAEEPKWFSAPALDKAPDFVLGLNDPVWEKALKISFTKLDGAPGDTTKYPTESYWLYANGSLFVGFKCVNPSSPRLWGTPGQLQDTGIYTKEGVELFVGDVDGDLYYQLIVDAAGNIFDGQRADHKWNGDWKCNVDRQAGYWTVVYEIPASILATIWTAGSFVTIDVTRHGFNPDGSGGEATAISPPGVHSPQDRVFLGRVNPALLGGKLSRAVQALRGKFANTSFSQGATDRLAAMDAFAATCAGSGDISPERYREFFWQYVQFGRELKGLEQEIVLGAIFSAED